MRRHERSGGLGAFGRGGLAALAASGVLTSAGGVVAGCDGDAAGDAPAADVAAGADGGLAVRAACEGGGRGAATGCAEGQVVDASGAPVAGIRVAGCTPATCITGTTGPDGRFAIQGLPVAPHKFEALAVAKGLFATVFFADVTAGRMVGPTRPVVLHPLPAARASGFDPDAGGTLSLADGALVLEAGPGALGFPIGTASEGAAAAFIPVETLPEYDVAPWEGRAAGTFALVVHPFPLSLEAGVTLTLRPPAEAGAGPWDLHVVNGSTGRLEAVGPLEADADGRLRLLDASRLRYATVLVAVPR
jgi:hypothetical protein